MQRPSHVGEHVPINMSRLYSRGDISLKIRDQTGRVRVPAVAAVAQVLEQLLQQLFLAPDVSWGFLLWSSGLVQRTPAQAVRW